MQCFADAQPVCRIERQFGRAVKTLRGDWQQHQVVFGKPQKALPGSLRLEGIELTGALLDAERAAEVGDASDRADELSTASPVPTRNRRAVTLRNDERDQHAGVDVDHGQCREA